MLLRQELNALVLSQASDILSSGLTSSTGIYSVSIPLVLTLVVLLYLLYLQATAF